MCIEDPQCIWLYNPTKLLDAGTCSIRYGGTAAWLQAEPRVRGGAEQSLKRLGFDVIEQISHPQLTDLLSRNASSFTMWVLIYVSSKDSGTRDYLLADSLLDLTEIETMERVPALLVFPASFPLFYHQPYPVRCF